MKKGLACFLCAVLIAACAAAFVGCDRVYIKGDFSTPATADEIAEMRLALRSDDIGLGDESADGWTYGVRMIATGGMTMDIDANVGTSLTLDSRYEMETDVDYATTFTKENGSLVARSGGNVRLSLSEVSGEGNSLVSLDGSVYSEKGASYLNGKLEMSGTGSGGENDLSVKGKYIIPAGLSVGEMAGGFDVESGDFVPQVVSMVLEVLDRTGSTVYIDDGGSEVKDKVSLNVDGYIQYLEDAYSSLVSALNLQDALKFDTADYYFSYDKETKAFTGYGAVAKASFEMESDGSSFSFKQDSAAWILVTDEPVETPSDLDSYSEINA